MHDPRIGRFFAVDPLAPKYPWYTPYQFSGNKVIDHVELEGLEEGPARNVFYYNKDKLPNGNFTSPSTPDHVSSQLTLYTNNTRGKVAGMYSPIPTGSYGPQNETTNVYVYWDNGKRIKEVVGTKSGVLESSAGSIGVGLLGNLHLDQMAHMDWERASSGSCAPCSILTPAVDYVHGEVSTELQDLGMSEESANNTASAITFVGSVVLSRRLGGAGAAPRSGFRSALPGNITRSATAQIESGSTTSLAPYWPANAGAVGEWTQVMAQTGQTFDRFGTIYGTYASPVGTPFAARALSPTTNAADYFQFTVIKPFPMRMSTVAPAFGQPGFGIQYQTPVGINSLQENGYIRIH